MKVTDWLPMAVHQNNTGKCCANSPHSSDHAPSVLVCDTLSYFSSLLARGQMGIPLICTSVPKESCPSLGILYLMSVQGYGCQGQCRNMKRAVLHEATDMTHGLSKDPCAVHKPNLQGTKHTSKTISRTNWFMYLSQTNRGTIGTASGELKNIDSLMVPSVTWGRFHLEPKKTIVNFRYWKYLVILYKG